jgi:hypothetical protein
MISIYTIDYNFEFLEDLTSPMVSKGLVKAVTNVTNGTISITDLFHSLVWSANSCFIDNVWLYWCNEYFKYNPNLI